MEKVGHVEKVQFGEGIVVEVRILAVEEKSDELGDFRTFTASCRVMVDGVSELVCELSDDSEGVSPPDFRRLSRWAVTELYHQWERKQDRLCESLSADELREDAERLSAEQNTSTY